MEISISNVGVPPPLSHDVWNVVCLPPRPPPLHCHSKENMRLKHAAAESTIHCSSPLRKRICRVSALHAASGQKPELLQVKEKATRAKHG